MLKKLEDLLDLLDNEEAHKMLLRRLLSSIPKEKLLEYLERNPREVAKELVDRIRKNSLSKLVLKLAWDKVEEYLTNQDKLISLLNSTNTDTSKILLARKEWLVGLAYSLYNELYDLAWKE